jgi:hypothetical protein
MKTKKTILFVFLLILSIDGRAQTSINDSLIVKKNVTHYSFGNEKRVYNILYEIDNQSCDTFYLWIEDNIHSSDADKIKDYFRKNKGDMSLYQMAMEVNITIEGIAVFYTFLKPIQSYKSFTIQIISTEEISECKKNKIFNYLDEHVVIVKKNILAQYINGLEHFNPIVFYKEEFLTLPLSLFCTD